MLNFPISNERFVVGVISGLESVAATTTPLIEDNAIGKANNS